MTFAVAIALETLDPYNTNSTLNQAAGKAYEGLFEFDKDLKVQKVLATDYTVSEDGLVYTFKLREASSSMTAPTSTPKPSRSTSTARPTRTTACRATSSSASSRRPKWWIR